MVVYNSVAGLLAGQFVVVAVIGAAGLLGAVATGARPPARLVLAALGVAVVVAVASSAIGTGRHSGMIYVERLGWPVPWFTVLRDIEIGTDVAVPFARELDPLKFAAATTFWALVALLTLAQRSGGRSRVIAAAALAAMVVLTAGFSWLNGTGRTGEAPVGPATASPGTVATLDAELVAARRRIIEQTFPEFADFENQPSFAGTSVKVVEDDGEYWFAYIVHGSGLPIVHATCFRADRVKGYQVGEFPDPLDSYAGYRDVDPRTCRGIK